MTDTTSSSSPPHTTVVLSDPHNQPSTPPSSPPNFPWEQSNDHNKLSNEQTSHDAFTLLRKRKALTPVSLNDLRPPKRVATSQNSTSKPLTQMQISLGQQIQKTCPQCGMEYTSSSAEDRKLHDTFHKDFVEGCEVGKDFVRQARPGTVFPVPGTKDVICTVDYLDRAVRKKKAQAVLEKVERELGAVPVAKEKVWDVPKTKEGPKTEMPAFTAYLYVRETRCVGFVLTEKITEARQVLPPETQPKLPRLSVTTSRGTALAAIRARAQRRATEGEAATSLQYPLSISERPCKARLGISRIWTLPKMRQQGIAISLLDNALRYTSTRLSQGASRGHDRRAEGEGEDEAKAIHAEAGQLLRKTDVAFSQPTESGARLARRWFGRPYGWKVYSD